MSCTPCMCMRRMPISFVGIITMMIRKRVDIGMVDRRQNYLLLELLLDAWIHFFRIQQIYRMRKLWCRQFFAHFHSFTLTNPVCFSCFHRSSFVNAVSVVVYYLQGLPLPFSIRLFVCSLQTKRKRIDEMGKKAKKNINEMDHFVIHKSFDYDSWKWFIIKYGKPITVPFFAMFSFSSVQKRKWIKCFYDICQLEEIIIAHLIFHFCQYWLSGVPLSLYLLNATNAIVCRLN